MTRPPEFQWTPELLELEEKIREQLQKYLTLKQAEMIKQQADEDLTEDDAIPEDFLLTAWVVAGEFTHMDPAKRGIIMGSQPRHVTIPHASGIANYWF